MQSTSLVFRTKWWDYQNSKSVDKDTDMGCISEFCLLR